MNYNLILMRVSPTLTLDCFLKSKAAFFVPRVLSLSSPLFSKNVRVLFSKLLLTLNLIYLLFSPKITLFPIILLFPIISLPHLEF